MAMALSMRLSRELWLDTQAKKINAAPLFACSCVNHGEETA